MKSITLSLFVLFFTTIFLYSCEGDIGDHSVSGEQWQVYTKSNTKNGLVNDVINDIFVDASNKKWFATNEGVSGFSRTGWITYKSEVQFTDPRFGRTSYKVNAITDGINSSLWFGLGGGGIRRFTAAGLSQTWTSFTSPTISANVITDLATDQYNDIWAVTFNGISRFTPNPNEPTTGQWQTYSTFTVSVFPTNFFSAVASSPVDFRIWFGTEYGQLISFDDINGWQVFRTPNDASPVNALCVDRFAQVWVATNQGVHRFSTSSGWLSYTSELTDSALPSNVVNSVLCDPSGTVWLGTAKGLAKLSPNGWSKFTRSNSPLPSENITALALDLRSNLWIGTNRGVAVYNENGIR
jgi:ligand-binding sensor domain-containing protein